MKKISIYFLCIMILVVLTIGCGGGSRMHQTKDRTVGGLPRMAPQMAPDEKGAEAIKLTPDLIYPGSASYEGAKYFYVSADSPEKVASWFEQNLKGSSSNKTSDDPADYKVVISYKGLEIDVVTGPHGSDTLIQYKTPINSKTLEQAEKEKEPEKK